MKELKNEPNYFLEILRSAYDVSSCGLGVQLRTVEIMHQSVPNERLPRLVFTAFTGHDSNYIADSYVLGWLESDPTPEHTSVYDQEHRRVIETMFAQYESLHWKITRNALDTSLGATSKENTKPITDQELKIYLRKASQLNLLERNLEDDRRTIDEVVRDIQEDDIRYGEPNPLDIRNRLLRNGVHFSQTIYEVEDQLITSERYRDEMLRASIYKLGSMLAITDQLLCDAYASKKPISASYRPTGIYNWNEVFDEDVPTIADLYTKAYEVFVRYADRNDPILKHLFSLDISQYLTS